MARSPTPDPNRQERLRLRSKSRDSDRGRPPSEAIHMSRPETPESVRLQQAQALPESLSDMPILQPILLDAGRHQTERGEGVYVPPALIRKRQLPAGAHFRALHEYIRFSEPPREPEDEQISYQRLDELMEREFAFGDRDVENVCANLEHAERDEKDEPLVLTPTQRATCMVRVNAVRARELN